MLKKLMLVGAVILMLAGGGLANQPYSENFEQFDAAVGTAAWRGHGPGLAQGVNGAFVGLCQNGQVGRRGHSEQSVVALLGQGAIAWGRGGESRVSQMATTAGEQYQRVLRSTGDDSPVYQHQHSGTSLGQTTHMVGGNGGAAGLNVGLVDMNQGTVSRTGVGEQRQTTLILQGAFVQGGPLAAGKVVQSAVVNATQSQNF